MRCRQFGIGAAATVPAAPAGVGSEGLLGEVEARAAAGGDTGLFLEGLETAAAVRDKARDVAVGDPVADADDHGSAMIMRTVRID